MPDIQWDGEASLMRVTTFSTADPQEALVGVALEFVPDEQDGLLIRAAGSDWVQEYDEDAIRELAARPEYTAAHGAYDTADLPSDPDRAQVPDEETIVADGVSGPSHTDARGRDGER